MGVLSQAAYDLGVAFGIASFQYSVGQDPLGNAALESGDGAMHSLRNAKLLPLNGGASVFSYVASNMDHLPLQNGAGMYGQAVAYRQHVEAQLRGRSNPLGNLLRLGVDMGVAEGQCTSPDWQHAVGYAHTALSDARVLVQHTFSPQSDQDLLALVNNALASTQNFGSAQGDVYNSVSQLRTTMSTRILYEATP